MLNLPKPYLLFMGCAQNPDDLKTAIGLYHHNPDACLAQWCLDDATYRIPGLDTLSLAEAKQQGVRSVVIGTSCANGRIDKATVVALARAARLGFYLISGLHEKLVSIPILQAAQQFEGQYIELRDYPYELKVGNGLPRSGKRLLTVGTDCSVGKMYTALAIYTQMRKLGISARFCATGQTGILIEGRGVPVDAIVSDFISGSIERLSPEHTDDHWSIIEGQGSLHHPGFAGVSLGLLHGAQPDALVICHHPTRSIMRGTSHQPLPSLRDTLELNLTHARLTNPEALVVGISVNTSQLDSAEAAKTISRLSDEFQLPCVDPVRTGVEPIVSELRSLSYAAL